MSISNQFSSRFSNTSFTADYTDEIFSKAVELSDFSESCSFTRCYWRDCINSNNGGGLSVSFVSKDHTVSISGCRFESCRADSPSDGGAVFISGAGSVSLHDLWLTSCVGTHAGALFLSECGEISLQNLQVGRCVAQEECGGIFIQISADMVHAQNTGSKPFTLTNTSFYQNSCFSIISDDPLLFRGNDVFLKGFSQYRKVDIRNMFEYVRSTSRRHRLFCDHLSDEEQEDLLSTVPTIIQIGRDGNDSPDCGFDERNKCLTISYVILTLRHSQSYDIPYFTILHMHQEEINTLAMPQGVVLYIMGHLNHDFTCSQNLESTFHITVEGKFTGFKLRFTRKIGYSQEGVSFQNYIFFVKSTGDLVLTEATFENEVESICFNQVIQNTPFLLVEGGRVVIERSSFALLEEQAPYTVLAPSNLSLFTGNPSYIRLAQLDFANHTSIDQGSSFMAFTLGFDDSAHSGFQKLLLSSSSFTNFNSSKHNGTVLNLELKHNAIAEVVLCSFTMIQNLDQFSSAAFVTIQHVESTCSFSQCTFSDCRSLMHSRSQVIHFYLAKEVVIKHSIFFPNFSFPSFTFSSISYTVETGPNIVKSAMPLLIEIPKENVCISNTGVDGFGCGSPTFPCLSIHYPFSLYLTEENSPDSHRRPVMIGPDLTFTVNGSTTLNQSLDYASSHLSIQSGSGIAIVVISVISHTEKDKMTEADQNKGFITLSHSSSFTGLNLFVHVSENDEFPSTGYKTLFDLSDSSMHLQSTTFFFLVGALHYSFCTAVDSRVILNDFSFNKPFVLHTPLFKLDSCTFRAIKLVLNGLTSSDSKPANDASPYEPAIISSTGKTLMELHTCHFSSLHIGFPIVRCLNTISTIITKLTLEDSTLSESTSFFSITCTGSFNLLESTFSELWVDLPKSDVPASVRNSSGAVLNLSVDNSMVNIDHVTVTNCGFKKSPRLKSTVGGFGYVTVRAINPQFSLSFLTFSGCVADQGNVLALNLPGYQKPMKDLIPSINHHTFSSPQLSMSSALSSSFVVITSASVTIPFSQFLLFNWSRFLCLFFCFFGAGVVAIFLLLFFPSYCCSSCLNRKIRSLSSCQPIDSSSMDTPSITPHHSHLPSLFLPDGGLGVRDETDALLFSFMPNRYSRVIPYKAINTVHPITVDQNSMAGSVHILQSFPVDELIEDPPDEVIQNPQASSPQFSPASSPPVHARIVSSEDSDSEDVLNSDDSMSHDSVEFLDKEDAESPIPE